MENKTNIIHVPFGCKAIIKGNPTTIYTGACRLALMHIERCKEVEVPGTLRYSLRHDPRGHSLRMFRVGSWHAWAAPSSLNDLDRVISHVTKVPACQLSENAIKVPRVRLKDWGRLRPYEVTFCHDWTMRYLPAIVVSAIDEFNVVTYGVVRDYPFLPDFENVLSIEDFTWIGIDDVPDLLDSNNLFSDEIWLGTAFLLKL